MASGLLALLDDMVVLLDDIAAMSKVAVKKTTGVVGDDLAVSAHQVTGSASDRELPIVWAVTKGSLKNKLIIVPLALLLSAFLPAAIPVILLCGGAFLCYEGMEKVVHSMSKHEEDHTEQEKLVKAAENPSSLLKLERQKIKGAIKTDFVLSIEIVFIALGTMLDKSIGYQVAALSFVAFLITVGVYGLVALIVRMDDVGLSLTKRNEIWAQKLGGGILWFAPWLLKTLAVLGTLAMILVGGELIAHTFHELFHLNLTFFESWATLSHLGLGVIAGSILVMPGLVFASKKKAESPQSHVEEEHLVTEGVAGVWHYHLSTPKAFTRGLCGAKTMKTAMSLSSFGQPFGEHFPKRPTWCTQCQQLANRVVEKTSVNLQTQEKPIP